MPDPTVPMTPERLRGWAVEVFLPFWVVNGFDTHRGCFHESLDLAGAAVPSAATRSRVQARQAYTMAAGARLTGDPLYRIRCAGALDFLLSAYRRPDGLIAATATPAGRIVDDRALLYDQAFALFALGHGIAVCPDRADAFEAAADTLWAAVADRQTHPAGGFREQAEGAGPRLQNPHMHLLEACLALAAATGRGVWIDRAADLVALFDRAFFDPATGSVVEYMTDDLSAPDPDRGGIREPGHGCEWAWLLDEAGKVGAGPDPHPATAILWRSAVRQGEMHASGGGLGLTLDVGRAPDDAGYWIDPVRRVWPQTEAVKAALAVARHGGDKAAAADRLALLFTHWLDPRGALWVERVDPAGAAVDATCPASTPYHIMVAVEEVLRGTAV